MFFQKLTLPKDWYYNIISILGILSEKEYLLFFNEIAGTKK